MMRTRIILYSIFPVANRFDCPYNKGKVSNAKFDIKDLFELTDIAFAIEIASDI